VLALDRAGLVGADGATHMGAFDLSYLRCLPNMTVMAPADENECRQMLYTAFTACTGPSAVRYPRGSGPGAEIVEEMTALPLGKAEVRRRGEGIAILAFGTVLAAAQEAGEALNATVVNMRFVKPLDGTLVGEMATTHDLIVTAEENAVFGGAGSAVNEYLAAAGLTPRLLNLGIPDQFIAQASQAQQQTECGLDAEGIRRAILRAAPVRLAPQRGTAYT
jgi:1-deoxy-D-xylulose-5-phosphate synthase